MDSNSSTETVPTTPILIFTPDPSDTSATSSPSECSENMSGWGTTSTSLHSTELDEHVHNIDISLPKDTAYATLHDAKGGIAKQPLDLDNLLWKSQIQRGAPVIKNNINATATSLTNDKATSTTSEDSSYRTQRRHSSTYESNVPYRQSSLKWKQRNGSATFELKLSQEEFAMNRHTAVFAE